MNNGQLHIFVKKSQVTDEITPQDTGQVEVEKNDLEKNNFQQQAIISALINTGQQAISQGIQVYSQLTGDTQFANVFNAVTSVGADILTIAKGGPVGAVIVKNKRIVATGYNGAPSGVENCLERGYCMRNKLKIESGTKAELCYAVHAEQNAIVQAAKLGISVEGATIYVNVQPCVICAKMIINAGIEKVYIRDDEANYRVISVQEWIDNDESLDMIEGY